MIKELIKLADHLDQMGYHEEANYIDKELKKAANSWGNIGRAAKWLGRHSPGFLFTEVLMDSIWGNEAGAGSDCSFCHRDTEWAADWILSQMDLEGKQWPEEVQTIYSKIFDNCCSWTQPNDGDRRSKEMYLQMALRQLQAPGNPNRNLFFSIRETDEEAREAERRRLYDALGHPY